MPTATRGAASVLISATADDVYRLVTDVTSIGDRSPECHRAEWLDGATTAAPGARFRGHNKVGWVRWSTTCVVTVADPPHEFGFVVVSGKGREETRWSYVIEPVHGAVRLSESYEFVWCPVAARIAELPFPRDRQLRRGLAVTLDRIKAAAEKPRTATTADVGS